MGFWGIGYMGNSYDRDYCDSNDFCDCNANVCCCFFNAND
jgi:hypothetical protein